MEGARTAELRDSIRGELDAFPMFDRGYYVRKVKAEGGLVWPAGSADPDDYLAVPG